VGTRFNTCNFEIVLHGCESRVHLSNDCTIPLRDNERTSLQDLGLVPKVCSYNDLAILKFSLAF
jgi:hypothetical protein